MISLERKLISTNKIDIGCGNKPKDGYVGIDIRDEAKLNIIKEDIWATDKIHGDVYKTLCAILQK